MNNNNETSTISNDQLLMNGDFPYIVLSSDMTHVTKAMSHGPCVA